MASVVQVHAFIATYGCDDCVSESEVVITSPRFIALHLLVYEIAECIA